MFERVNRISISKSRWILSLMVDLKPFDSYLAELKRRVLDASVAAKTAYHRFNKSDLARFASVFSHLTKEVNHLKQRRDVVMSVFDEYHSIGGRMKRSLFPFLGKALSWLVGTVSEDDINNVKSGLQVLKQNQGKIMHILSKSITMSSA